MITKQVKLKISNYSFEEEVLNAITHAFGLVLSIIGVIFLIVQAAHSGTKIHMYSYIIFGASLIAVYLSSTLYHSFSNTKFHTILKQIDHLAIYFLIAGTYTPLMLIGTKGPKSIEILGVVWTLVIVGCFCKLSKNKILQKIAFLNYLIMGWLVVLVFDEVKLYMPPTSLYFLFCGGILYTSGVIFYCWEKLRFSHSIWHMFVIGGSTSHYFSIYCLLA
jgi:hemolysin III